MASLNLITFSNLFIYKPNILFTISKERLDLGNLKFDVVIVYIYLYDVDL